jgi:hypothetical protein
VGPSKLAAAGPRAAGSRLVNVVAEMPAGSRNNSKFDEKLSVRDLRAGLLEPIEQFFAASCR